MDNKIKLLLLLTALSVAPIAFAKPFKNVFIGYIIRPSVELNWSSPQSLAITTAKSARSSAYAPIGHFATEIRCETPNRYGTRHVMTGMETHGDTNSKDLTLKKKLGLGTLFYKFNGNLQSASYVQEIIQKAKRDGRLVKITIPTSAERCQKGLEFIDNWIRHGSYTVYGANLNVREGEGAGCADFAMELFQIATSIFPREAILARVLIPYRLIGDGEQKKVPFTKILFAKKWAEDEVEGKPHLIMDTNKTIKFLFEDSKVIEEEYTYVKHLFGQTTIFSNTQVIDYKEEIESQAQILPPFEVDTYNFTFTYPQRETTEETWQRISLEEKRPVI